MRGAAEESLNTLHFASMAARIKAQPVILLDPQVVGMRLTLSDSVLNDAAAAASGSRCFS